MCVLMWIKLFAVVSLGAVVVFGAALVSKAKSSHRTAGVSAAHRLRSSPRFVQISEGEAVRLADHTDPDGKYTIFLFGADW